ncbi:hypothetical protein AALF85_02495 [Jeotgalicoccus halotolerans]|uniref:hypothetical protein n=1 Tax=Jeotgalicoccus halotolerans TaxID=157227 RepID=UPI003513B0BB
MFNKKDLKTVFALFLVLSITFSSFALYRAAVIDPVQDEIYAEVHGLEGDEKK